MADRITVIGVNLAGLVDISNQVNESVCKPIAEKVAERARASAPVESGAYRDSIHVLSDARTGVDDWAHTRVVATDSKALFVESRTGNLARALTGTSRSKAMRASRMELRAHKKSLRNTRPRRTQKKQSLWSSLMERGAQKSPKGRKK